MKPIYKTVKAIAEHCPDCNTCLRGSNSAFFPWYCECGTWKMKDILTGEYELVDRKKP